jgi:hypothetical protein
MSFQTDHLQKPAAAVRGGVLKIHARPQTATSLSRARTGDAAIRPEIRPVSCFCHHNVLNRRALFGDPHDLRRRLFLIARSRGGGSPLPI